MVRIPIKRNTAFKFWSEMVRLSWLSLARATFILFAKRERYKQGKKYKMAMMKYITAINAGPTVLTGRPSFNLVVLCNVFITVAVKTPTTISKAQPINPIIDKNFAHFAVSDKCDLMK